MKNIDAFPNRLREARIHSKLKQKELAQKSGLTPATISACEKGTKNPSLSSVIDIAKALNVSLDWLCGEEIGTNEPDANKKTISSDEFFRILVFLVSKCGADISFKTYENSYFDPYAEVRETITTKEAHLSWASSRQNLIIEFLESLSQLLELRRKDILTEDLFQSSVNGVIGKYKFDLILGLKPEVVKENEYEEIDVDDSDLPF